MRVLVTGSTGYIGSRLVPALIGDGHHVVAAMRDPSRAGTFAWSDEVEVREFDLAEPATLATATHGIDAVIYLVHSMAAGDFVRKDQQAAEAMVDACEINDVGRIVYLSGLVPPADNLSDHIRSRLDVEETFLNSSIPTLVLRAAVIIGSGSTSFELVRRLTERLPVTPLPTWLTKKVQPIAVEDVVYLLTAALKTPPRNDHFDVGGDEIVTYTTLLQHYASVAGLQRFQLQIPFLLPSLVGPAAAVITRIPHRTVAALVESLRHDMICGDHRVRGELDTSGHDFLSIDEAIRRSLTPHDTGTQPDGDVQAPARSDPEWAGGEIHIDGTTPVHQPRSLLSRILLGPKRHTM